MPRRLTSKRAKRTKNHKTSRISKRGLKLEKISDPRDVNELRTYLLKTYITQKNEQQINKIFNKNPLLRAEYTSAFIKKMATLKKTTYNSFQGNSTSKQQVQILQVHKSISLDNNQGDFYQIPLDKSKYEIYITDFVRGIASVIVIKKNGCNVQHLTFEKKVEGFGCEGFINIGNTEEVLRKQRENIFEYDLHGRQVYGTFPVFIGKTKTNKTECVVIPLLEFFMDDYDVNGNTE